MIGGADQLGETCLGNAEMQGVGASLGKGAVGLVLAVGCAQDFGFGVLLRLELYSHSELATIIKRSASLLEVEIDDEYIYFYRSYGWSDTIRRAKFTYNGSTSQDIQERVKISEQFTGSEYNVTVYLCPFPLEELLTSNKVPQPPSQGDGIWDESLWDSGKEWG